MLVIRLKRIGKKNKPTYRVVVAEHTAAVNGSFVEDLGFYNPYSKELSINQEAALEWFNKGAKPSNTVARLLEKAKLKHKSIVVIKYNKAPKKKVEEVKPVAKPDTSETGGVADEVPTEEARPTELVEETSTETTDKEPATEETPSDSSADTVAEASTEDEKSAS